jgi:hypothetical protein
MNKIVVGIVAAILIVAAVCGVLFWASSTAAAKEEVTGNVTVYVEDATTGQMMGATVKLGQETFGESAMLAFGVSIRQATFQPLGFAATITGINPYTAYNVWVNANISVSSVSLSSLSTSTVTFTGTSGATGHPSCLVGTYISQDSVAVSNRLSLGQTVGVDMFVNGGKKFNNIWASPATTVSVGTSRALIGSDVNGMKVNVTAQATGQPGNVTSTVTQTLAITANYAAATLTITVTGITVTGPTSTMISPFQVETLATTVKL